MAVLQLNELHFQLDSGDNLFSGVSASLNTGKVGVVGKNGAGKSLLMSLIAKRQPAFTGSITVTPSLAFYQQSISAITDQTIAAFLGVESALQALTQISNGQCEQYLFDVVGEQWQLPETLSQQLMSMGLPRDPMTHCSVLSGGQQAKLRLWRTLEQKAELNLLDEPSNHLDREGRRWLLDCLSAHRGAVIIVSHDRELLRTVDKIWELASGKLHQYAGNYDAYAHAKTVQQTAAEQKLKSLNKQKASMHRTAQLNAEKAEQRAAQGNKARVRGSQPKVLLDAMRDRATAAASNRNSNLRQRQRSVTKKIDELKDTVQVSKPQNWTLATPTQRRKWLVRAKELVLQHGSHCPLTFTLTSSTKLSLRGNNGTGKSSLLKTLLGTLPRTSGELMCNCEFFYLDQHFSDFDTNVSALDYLSQHCSHLDSSFARTLLANIGLRGDFVYRPVKCLSGGEKVKLALLIANNQKQFNVLLLDEPDNHLDLDSKAHLAKALSEYPSAFIMVSHDEDFIADSGVTEAITISLN